MRRAILIQIIVGKKIGGGGASGVVLTLKFSVLQENCCQPPYGKNIKIWRPKSRAAQPFP